MSNTHKSTENTVFCKFSPPSSDITRFHLTEIFSQIAPIKKCSIIRNKETNKGMGYGFCKFLSKDDCEKAYQQLNNTYVTLDNVDGRFKLTVEMASNQVKDVVSASKATPSNESTIRKVSTDDQSTTDDQQQQLLLAKRKRTSRVIVRNVSFYANEHAIQSVLEKEYGPIVELTLPRVSAKLHRGFCFVTFERERDAQRAVQPRSTPLLIKKRPVAIDYAVSKQQHQMQQQQQQSKRKDVVVSSEKKEEESDDSSSSSDDDSDSDDDEEIEDETVEKEHTEKAAGKGIEDDDSSSSDESSDDSDSDDDDASESSSAQPTKHEAPEHDAAVDDHRSLFCRNLPFDATRHDLFELFSPFGYIESIYLVKDKTTGVNKGTAFLAFRDAKGAEKALQAAGSNDGGFVTQREGSAVGGGESAGLHLRGRRLFVDVAVDKKTAASLTVDKQQGNKVAGKDRRNLYLKMEGRVANEADSSNNNNAWENLPESDQLKRQRAFAEKNTKLRSPLFFINSQRLSIRNLAKHVDESTLKKLVVKATRRGLDTNLVTQEDQVAHWRAGGDLTTRDIMKRIEAAKEENGSVIPVFDERNVKRFISSAYIDRDFTTNKKEKAPSRGFGFVDFEHHAHALACLRELNNNPYYSAEFVAGGKKAVDAKKQARKRKKTDLSEDGRVLTPRLIVDFTVENKAKAKKQAEHRAQQQANIEKQRLELKEKKLAEGADKKRQKKKSRGALQREKKRKQKESMESGETNDDVDVDQIERFGSARAAVQEEVPKQKVKTVKPPKKKRKVDKEEQDFEDLVDSYRKTFSRVADGANEETNVSSNAKDRPTKAERRWFE